MDFSRFITPGLMLAALAAQPALASTPEHMMAQCRNRAHNELRIRLPDIDTKYEGQRTDGTHAVNGTASVQGRNETFQCSFDRAGNRIVHFVVNRPSGHGSASQLPATGVASGIETRPVYFRPGAHATTVEGRIRGDHTIDYVLRARAGQHANISMASRNGSAYFNLIAPGETDVAFFNGSTSTNQYEGRLPKDGDYKIRVYLMRAAARRNETANFRLEMHIDAAQGAPVHHASTDAKVPGTNFHATGPLPCAMAPGQPVAQCQFGVTRQGGGSAIVTITRPDGRKRVITFERGRATGYDQSQADTAAFRANRQGDATIVHVGGERYEIIDAVVFGG